jgi:outer membrane protein OmpA-like peptidoglycan-associated protein
VAEDFDGVRDTDGCPDPDDDGDGLVDAQDRCPGVAEDRDGFEDADGCPDPDNDRDGVLDGADRCPLVAEDFDLWEDADGCPDPDNDRDGILDAADRCPLEAEVVNGVEDGDGCPDAGTTRVRLEAAGIVVDGAIEFERGHPALRPSCLGLLDELSALLKAHGNLRLEVRVWPPARGPGARNADLAQARAESIVRYLVDRGTLAARLSALGLPRAAPGRSARVEFGVVGGR